MGIYGLGQGDHFKLKSLLFNFFTISSKGGIYGQKLRQGNCIIKVGQKLSLNVIERE